MSETTRGREIWVTAYFLQILFVTHVWLIHIRNAYFMTQNFVASFLKTKKSDPPTQYLIFGFSLKCVGVTSFWFHNQIKRKIWHRMICIDQGLGSYTPTQRRFQIKGFFTPRQYSCVRSIGLWVVPSCAESSNSLKKSSI